MSAALVHALRRARPPRPLAVRAAAGGASEATRRPRRLPAAPSGIPSGHVKGHQKKPQSGRRKRDKDGPEPWETFVTAGFDNEVDSASLRSARVDVLGAELNADSETSRKTLHWHEETVQSDHLAEDAVVHRSYRDVHSCSWWRRWQAEWDEGWDWEDKWHPAPGAALQPRDDPRRPQGPLLKLPQGHYKPVAALSHVELVAAVVAAYHDPPGEVMWQALCTRAERVAVSLTPAEVLAVVRCVAERQAGQLKLLWKLASIIVEKLAAFTTDDLVCFATVYASLDAVHHGLLNVIVLILADDEDERNITSLQAVELLVAFSRAKYPLPLLIEMSKRELTKANEGVGKRPPEVALRGLNALTQMGELDEACLASLLPQALAPLGSTALPNACAACSWVLVASKHLQRLQSNPFAEGVAEPKTSHIAASWSQDALAAVTAAARGALALHDPQHLRLVRSGTDKTGPKCLVPACMSVAGTSSPTIVNGAALLAAVELLATAGIAVPDDAAIVNYILEGAVARPGHAEMWPLHLQVRWLALVAQGSTPIASTTAELAPADASKLAPSAAAVSLVQALIAVRPHALLPRAPELLGAVHALAEWKGGLEFTQSLPDAVKLACVITKEAQKSLFRLTLRESHAVVRESLWLSTHLPKKHAATLQPEAVELLSVAAASLPAKFRAENVFHRRGAGGIAAEDVVAWCSLLADAELLAVARTSDGSDIAATEMLDEAWSHALEEALQVVRRGDLDDAASALLASFVAEGSRRGWDVMDEQSPLGCLTLAIQNEWKRAIARDGELEDPYHEPLPIPSDVERRLRELFHELGIAPPESLYNVCGSNVDTTRPML